jgi:hypothetical protein
MKMIRKYKVYCPDTKIHALLTEGEVSAFLEEHPRMIINGSEEVEEKILYRLE